MNHESNQTRDSIPRFPEEGSNHGHLTSNIIVFNFQPGKVKPIYWQQMQLQMAVLDLELSHFLECTFQEYPSEKDFWIDFDYDGYDNKEKGIIIELVDHDVTNLAGEPKTTYQYSPIELCEDENQMRLWYKQQLSKMISSPTQIYIRTHFWVLPVCSCVNVIRDREWFSNQIPKFVKFWNDVENYRKGGGIDQLEVDIETNKPKKNL